MINVILKSVAAGLMMLPVFPCVSAMAESATPKIVPGEVWKDVAGDTINAHGGSVLFSEGKYVLWFHLELKGQSYGAARCAVAVSDSPVGPFSFVKSGRVNAGKMPLNLSKENASARVGEKMEWWTPDIYGFRCISKRVGSPCRGLRDGLLLPGGNPVFLQKIVENQPKRG